MLSGTLITFVTLLFLCGRLAGTIKDRVQCLDEALQTRDQVGDGIQEANDWLTQIQTDLKNIPRTIGPGVHEAEDVLRQYEVSWAKTNYGHYGKQTNYTSVNKV